MEMQFGVVFMFVIGIIGIVECAYAIREELVYLASLCLVVTVFAFSASYQSFDHQRRLERRLAEMTLSPTHRYIVKVKPSTGMPLFVYDMVDKKDRIIDFDFDTEIYPPSGFTVVVATDGKVMLIPK